jgi:hypothetical protein
MSSPRRQGGRAHAQFGGEVKKEKACSSGPLVGIRRRVGRASRPTTAECCGRRHMMTQRAPLSAALVRATCASDSEQAGGPSQ